jgi:phosphopentomutase
VPRACVIVLDAVGAGELPDAAEYGDEGSDTLGNVARAVGGLDLPSLEAIGLGNIEELQGCPPQPGAPAIAGRLVERSKGKDTTAGHWELMGVVTETAFPSPSASMFGRSRPPTARATLPSVSEPSSP